MESKLDHGHKMVDEYEWVSYKRFTFHSIMMCTEKGMGIFYRPMIG